jgi:hypothetical protein
MMKNNNNPKTKFFINNINRQTMRFYSNFLIAALIGVIFLSNSAFAQRGVVIEYANPLEPSAKPTPIYFGPCVGINILGHSMDIPTVDDDNLCPNFKNASGIGLLGGLTFEYLFGEVATSSSSLIFRLMYNMYPGSVTVSDKNYPIFDAVSESVVSQSVERIMDIDYNALTFEVMYKINPIPGYGLGIIVGPSFDYLITKNRTQKYNLLNPLNTQFDPSKFNPNVTFENYNRTAVLYDGEIEDASAIRLGVKAGVQYEILLGSKLYIAPSLAYNFGITNLTSRYSWRVSPLQIALDARFAF